MTEIWQTTAFMKRPPCEYRALFDLLGTVNESTFRAKLEAIVAFDPTFLPTGYHESLFEEALGLSQWDIADLLLQKCGAIWGRLTSQRRSGSRPPLYSCISILAELHSPTRLRTQASLQRAGRIFFKLLELDPHLVNMIGPYSQRTPLGSMLSSLPCNKGVDNQQERDEHFLTCPLLPLAAFLIQLGGKICPIPRDFADLPEIAWDSKLSTAVHDALAPLIPVVCVREMVIEYARDAIGMLFCSPPPELREQLRERPIRLGPRPEAERVLEFLREAVGLALRLTSAGTVQKPQQPFSLPQVGKPKGRGKRKLGT